MQNNLRAVLEEKKIPLVELSRKTEIPLSRLSAVCGNYEKLSKEKMRIVSNALGTSMSNIFPEVPNDK